MIKNMTYTTHYVVGHENQALDGKNKGTKENPYIGFASIDWKKIKGGDTIVLGEGSFYPCHVVAGVGSCFIRNKKYDKRVLIKAHTKHLTYMEVHREPVNDRQNINTIHVDGELRNVLYRCEGFTFEDIVFCINI